MVSHRICSISSKDVKKAGNFPASPLESASWYNMAWRQINVSKAEI